METKNLGNEQVAMYRERFSSHSLPELIDLFNAQVGLNAWTSQRAYYLEALVQSIKSKGIYVDVIDTGQGIKLDKNVKMCGSTLITE